MDGLVAFRTKRALTMDGSEDGSGHEPRASISALLVRELAYEESGRPICRDCKPCGFKSRNGAVGVLQTRRAAALGISAAEGRNSSRVHRCLG